MRLRRLEDRDVEEIVARVNGKLRDDARRRPVLSATFDQTLFANALRAARARTWVAVDGERLVGHLYGAVLENDEQGRGAWVGPDGVSFDDGNVLAALYGSIGDDWLAEGAREHYVWVFDEYAELAPWYDLGFARVHARGVLRLHDRPLATLPEGYAWRRGGVADLALAVELDAVLEQAQREGPSYAFGQRGSRRGDLLELLEDDDVRHYVVERDGEGVAQCFTFGLDARRGSFAHAVHVSGVAVRPSHQRRGVGRALIDLALADAAAMGYDYAETNWRVTNRRAAAFWPRYGFVPTYVRLHRTIETP